MMEIKYLTAVLILSASTGAMAVNCDKNPSHPSCGGEPEPDLTTRVEALELEVDALQFSDQTHDARIQDVEDTLSNMQPSNGWTPVLVDARGETVGALSTITLEDDVGDIFEARVFVKLEGDRSPYRMFFFLGRNTSGGWLYAEKGLGYTDATCGLSGGEAVYVTSGPQKPLSYPVAENEAGDFFVPDPAEPLRRITLYSLWLPDWHSNGGECLRYEYPPSAYVITPKQVTFDIAMPVHLEYR